MQSIKDKFIENFLEMVRISSPTGEVKEFQDYLLNRFEDLGFRAERDKFDNLIFKTKKFDPKKSLLITTHIDTVSPGKNIRPKVSGDYVTSDGTTVLGADPKAGIASLVTILDNFKKAGKCVENLEVIFSTNEEEGDHTLHYAKVVSKKAIVLDNGSAVGSVEVACPFAKVFLVDVKGKEVYAQIDYDKGANAIATLSSIISSMTWGFYRSGCVANTGVISGGKCTTSVAPSAMLKGNIYCFKEDEVEKFLVKLEAMAKKADVKFGTKTKIKILETYLGGTVNENNDFFKVLHRVYVKHGVRVVSEKKLLVSPTNCLIHRGVEAVNLGLGYSGHHTVKEKFSISQIVKLTEILGDYLEESHCEK